MTPRHCIFFRPTFRKTARSTNRADYFRQADAKFGPRGSSSGSPHHLYVNAPAARIIEAAIGAQFGTQPSLGGVTIGTSEATAIEESLRNLAAREDRHDVKASILIVAEELSRALATDSVVTIINADASISAEELRAIEREEELHRAILDSAGEFSERFVCRFLSIPETKSVLERFRQARPDAMTPLQIVNELPVLLITGEWGRLGLTPGKAEQLWYLFVKLFIEEHGEGARAILEYGHPQHARKVAERIRRGMGEGIRAPSRAPKKRQGGQSKG